MCAIQTGLPQTPGRSEFALAKVGQQSTETEVEEEVGGRHSGAGGGWQHIPGVNREHDVRPGSSSSSF